MSSVTKEISKGYGIITVNRPEVLNALNRETIDALKEAFREFYVNEKVGAIILTGAGEKAFVAGADITEMSSISPNQAVASALNGQELTNIIESSTKPVIAAINGYALGGGCELALACHIRVASENTRFGQPEVKLGIIPGWGGTQRLPRLVGKGKAIEMVVGAEMISAQEAKEIGLVNYVVPQGELMAKAKEIASSILKRGPEAVRLSLEAINHGMDMSLTEGLQYEANLFGLVFSTEDKNEGIEAFLEKRIPRFQGK